MAAPDPNLTLGVFQKLADILRKLPLWLLGSLAATACALWKFQSFPVAAPGAIREWLPALALLFGVATTFKAAADGFSSLARHRRLASGRAKQVLEAIYNPINALFLVRHVSVSTGETPLFLRRRKAWQVLWNSRRVPNVSGAWRALADRGERRYASIDLGPDFPHGEILAIVRGNINFADEELLRLFRRADSSRYEAGDGSLLTDEELDLFLHVDSERDKLLRKARSAIAASPGA